MASRTRRKAPWIIAGLIAFVLADLALVGFALRDTAGTPAEVSAIEPGGLAATTPVPTGTPVATAPAATPTGAPQPTATGAPVPGTTATGAPATGAPVPATAVPVPVPISGMASSKVGFRATPGSCTGNDTSTDSVIELTTDGGTTWINVTPSDIRIRSVEKMIVVDESHVDLLAKYGDACTESDVTSYTQGEFWQVYPDRLAQFQ